MTMPLTAVPAPIVIPLAPTLPACDAVLPLLQKLARLLGERGCVVAVLVSSSDDDHQPSGLEVEDWPVNSDPPMDDGENGVGALKVGGGDMILPRIGEGFSSVWTL
jgi:hypothetical protein